jgi:hypothetical protein
MARGPSAYRQRDVSRVLQAAAAAGLRVTGFEVDPQTGKIRVETGKPQAQDSNPLDCWMAKHAHEA